MVGFFVVWGFGGGETLFIKSIKKWDLEGDGNHITQIFILNDFVFFWWILVLAWTFQTTDINFSCIVKFSLAEVQKFLSLLSSVYLCIQYQIVATYIHTRLPWFRVFKNLTHWLLFQDFNIFGLWLNEHHCWPQPLSSPCSLEPSL